MTPPEDPGGLPSRPVRMLIDCDPGVDDAIALLVAMSRSELVGVTTVNGNVSIDHTTANALAITEAAGPAGSAVPVHRGAPRPLVEPLFDAGHVHGATGLGGVALPAPSRSVASDDAVGFILDSARSTSGLQLVAVGPLTNIALAVTADPTLPSRLGGLTVMGGAASGGNVTAAAEFNIRADPEAAAIVFRSFPMTTMAGLDVTMQVLIGEAEGRRLRAAGTTAALLAADLLDHAIGRAAALAGLDAAPMHDATAVVSVLRPELFESQELPVDVELNGALTRGMTVADRRPAGRDGSRPAEPNARVLLGADSEAVTAEITDAVISLPA